MIIKRSLFVIYIYLILIVNRENIYAADEEAISVSSVTSLAQPIVFNTNDDSPLTYYKSSKFIAIRINEDESKESIIKLLDSLTSNFTRDIAFRRFQVFQHSNEGAARPSDAFSLPELSILSIGDKTKKMVNVYHSSLHDNTPFIPTGLIYLTLNESFQPDMLTELFETYQLTVKRSTGAFGIAVSVTHEDADPIEIASSLQHSPAIKYVEPSFTTSLATCQWHHANVGDHRDFGLAGLAIFKIGADARIRAAWKTIHEWSTLHLLNMLKPVRVAVIDDAFNLKHPDLGSNTCPEWIQAPRNFSNLMFLEDVQPASHKVTRHGTATSGLLLGRNNVGVAPTSIFIPVCYADEIEDASLMSTLTYCNEQESDIVSCSWGAKAKHYILSRELKRLITQLATTGRRGKGCVIIFAAGNNNVDIHDMTAQTVNGFAAHPDVIAVSASNSRDKKAHYSNYGENISVCAPSGGAGGIEGLHTCDVSGYNIGGMITTEYRGDFDGTSGACPIVAGTVSLMLSLNPQLTSKEVKEIIQISARQIDMLGGSYSLKPISLVSGGSYDKHHSPYYGYGCINADEAVKEVLRRMSGSESL